MTVGARLGSAPPEASPSGPEGFSRGALRAPLVLLRMTPGLVRTLLTNRTALPAVVGRTVVELGPLYIKIAQVLSTRSDMVPPRVVALLSPLRDEVPGTKDALDLLASNHPGALDGVFASLEQQPFAAGAVAQVHRGVLPSGEAVAVKILRPGVEQRLRADLALLDLAATLLERVSRTARVLGLRHLLGELGELLLSQTDLGAEARNLRAFRREFADHPWIVVPRVHRALTGPDVLVTDLVGGIDPYDVAHLPCEPRILARRLDDVVDTMVYVSGLCHADLHPGNFFWDPEGRLVLIDLGLVHRLSARERRDLLVFYSAVVDGHHEFAADHLLSFLIVPMADPGAEVPRAAVEDLRGVVDRHWRNSRGRPNFAAMFRDLVRSLGRHGLRLRHDFSRLFLMLATVEGYLYAIDPGFDMLANARQKRRSAIDGQSLPAAAEDLVLGDSGSWAAATFADGDLDASTAFLRRDAAVLDLLEVAEGTTLLDVACGRGGLLLAATERGSTAHGLAETAAAAERCRSIGVTAVRGSWIEADAVLPRPARFDALVLLETESHLSTLAELETGLADLHCRQFLGWARSRLLPGGRVVWQTACVSDSFVHGAAHRTAREHLMSSSPWLGFSSLAALRRAAPDAGLSLVQVEDRTSDLAPSCAFWRAGITAELVRIRTLTADDARVVLLRRRLDAITSLTEEGHLRLYRVVLRA